jgi:hypothetical protein
VRLRTDRAFAAFAASFFVFHQIGTVLATSRQEAAVDVLTPFVVALATFAVLRSFGLPASAVALAVGAGVLYVHGHGIHLAANSIHNEGIENDVVYFWDERFGHIEAVLGWFGLVAALCVAERDATERSPLSAPWLAAGALVLGWTFFTSTVEGQTWWMQLPAAAAFAVWARRARRPLLSAAAGAFAVGALLIAVWAAWHGGVPEFSDL